LTVVRSEHIRALTRELAAAKVRYAELYLAARRGPPLGKGTGSPSVDDARMGARIGMAAAGFRDPEEIRFDLYELIGLERAIPED